MIRDHLPGLLVGAVIILALFAAFSGVRAAECGKASYYCCQHHGRLMANGRPFNQNAMTAASNSLPLGSVASVRNIQNGKNVQVRITDTGGFAKYGRVIDLSRAAFAKLAPTSKGVISVCITRQR